MLQKSKIAVMGMLAASLLMSVSGSALAVWSSSTSEEKPPLTASNHNLINRFYCSGSYCDNIWINTVGTYRNFGSNYWTSFFSEEGASTGANQRICSGSGFMTGIACNGGYCDNVSIQCTTLDSTTRGSCYWTPYFSEEAAYSDLLASGYYAAGLTCRGSNCDDKSIYACLAY
jgi:hypothetical protein